MALDLTPQAFRSSCPQDTCVVLQLDRHRYDIYASHPLLIFSLTRSDGVSCSLVINFVYGRLMGQQGRDTWDLSLNAKRDQVVPVPPFHVSFVVCVTLSLLYLACGGLGLSSL